MRVDLDFPTEEIALQVAQAYLMEIAKAAAQPLGLAMVRAGLVGIRDNTKLARLVRAASLGAHRATLVEIEAIQQEESSGRAGN